jgi:hypothetical protein
MEKVGYDIQKLFKAIGSSASKLMQIVPFMFWFNSSQATDYTYSLFIILCLNDCCIRDLCHRAIEAQKKCGEAGDVAIFYSTGHVSRGMDTLPPITIQISPTATDAEAFLVLQDEKKRLTQNARNEARAYYDRQTRLEKELEEKMWDLRKKILDQTHELNSPEHALKQVIETAKDIKVVANEKDDDDEEEQLDEKSREVLAFVEACKKALGTIAP